MKLTDCWYSQLSSTLTPSAGGGGKGSPSSPGKKNDDYSSYMPSFNQFLPAVYPVGVTDLRPFLREKSIMTYNQIGGDVL